MIDFEDVSKSYWTGAQRKVILANESFRISRGQRLGILAANGTGKTTLINMICGLTAPDEGTIRRRCRVSFPLGGIAGLDNKLNGVENARYIARLYLLDPDYVECFCRYLSDLDEYFDQPVGSYSAGMRARLSFSLMLALDFDLYLVDEGLPSTADVGFRAKALPLLNERIARSSCVVVSHKPQVLEQLCTSAAVLRGGRLHWFNQLQDARAMYDYAA